MAPLSNTLALVAAFAAKAYAHGLVSGFNTDGTYNQGFILDYYYQKINSGSFPAVAGWYEEATDNGYVAPSSYGSADIICHKNAENGQATATVAAGGTVDFMWTTWPDSHIGPILTYVANCGGDCTTVDKTTLKFVKIDAVGIDLDTQKWPTEAMIANNNTYSVTVPSTLAAGNYVFRHEIIAMHGAGSVGGAQNYPFCMNIAITGGGSDNPEGTLGTELYTENDPGIVFNPYTTLTEYTIPGPALYGSGSTSSGSSGSGSSGSTPTTTGSGSTATATGSGSSSGSGSTPTTGGSSYSATPVPTGSSNNVATGSGSDSSSGSDSGSSGCSSTRRRRHARDVARQ